MKPLWKSLPLLAVLLFTVVQADGEEIIADTHFNKKPITVSSKCHPFQILSIQISPRSCEDKSRTSKFLPPSLISVKSNRVQLRAIRSEIAAEISCSLSSNLPHNPTLQSPQCDSEPHCLQSKSLGPPLSEIEQGLTSYLIPECPDITFPPNHQTLPHLTL